MVLNTTTLFTGDSKHSIKSDIFIQSRLNTRPVSLSLQQEPGVLSALVISVIGQCGPR